MSEITTYEKMKDSGIEWVGSVPSHWRVHALYQLVTQVKEKNSNLQEKNLLSLSLVTTSTLLYSKLLLAKERWCDHERNRKTL